MVGYSYSGTGNVDSSLLIPSNYLGISGVSITNSSVNATVHAGLARVGGATGGLVGRATVVDIDGSTTHGSVQADQVNADNLTGATYSAGGVVGESGISSIVSSDSNNEVTVTATEMQGQSYAMLYAGGYLGLGDTHQYFNQLSRDGDVVINGRNELPADNNSYGTISAGGLAGRVSSYNESIIENSMSSSDISISGIRGSTNINSSTFTSGFVGGLVGFAQSDTNYVIKNSSTSGNLVGTGNSSSTPTDFMHYLTSAGGLIGQYLGSTLNHNTTITGSLNIQIAK